MFELDIEKQINLRRQQSLFRQRYVRASPVAPFVNVDGQAYLSFSSNDYLGLANHPKMVEAFKRGIDCYGVGSGASALLGGYCTAHALLEEELAEFMQYPRCVLFPSGYMANLAIINLLAPYVEQIVLDKWVHASIIDACVSTSIPFRRYRHQAIDHARRLLDKKSLLITEGVFSMAGDCCLLDEIVALKKEKNTCLLIDDVHGIGVMGERGGGVVEGKQLSVDIVSGGFGKAFGTAGGFVVGSEIMMEGLIQFGRPYVYTTSAPPALIEATRQSLQLIQSEGWRRDKLKMLIAYFQKCAKQLAIEVTPASTPIQSMMFRDEKLTMNKFNLLKEKGIWVGAVRPPTVPPRQAMLRISLTANHECEHIDRLFSALTEST